MRTEKLYYQDPYRRDFSAVVLSKVSRPDGNWDIVLDRTAFYPEGGGQPCDLGTLSGLAVTDVRTKDGEIIHTVAGDPGPGPINGHIDWQRRFDLMQQHTGEHLLSGILLSRHQAENVGFHLSPASCQIDTTLPALTPELAGELEAAVNAAIWDNRPIAAHFVESDELAGYSLRKAPGKEFDQIRLVDIDGCDCCPCGGTHVASTGEVGLFKIRSWEKRKGHIRIEFVCGGRALADYQLKHETVRTLSALLSAPAEEVGPAFERQQEKLAGLQAELTAVRRTYHAELAARLLSEAAQEGREAIVQVFEAYVPADLQDFAGRITTAGAIALLASVDSTTGRLSCLFAAAPGTPIAMNELLRSALATVGGKGGGNALQAQGGASGADPAAVLTAAERLLAENNAS